MPYVRQMFATKEMIVGRLAAIVAILVVLAGCGGAGSTPENPASITVIADPAQTLCQPKNVPGNCWLPLFSSPVLTGNAVNQNDTCNNESQDQSACWPQPGTELKATCLQEGADKRPWYHVEVPRERVFSKVTLENQPEGPIGAYVSVEHLAIKDGDRVGSLVAC